MSDEHWYRNAEWGPQIEAAFNAKLGRSRSQKAQYLRIQGSTLKETHPAVAIELFDRCIAMDDPFQTAHAHLDQAHAYVVLGDIEGALTSLEAAIDSERRFPICRTSAPFDYTMMVALYRRSERYDAALKILDRLGAGPFALNDFQAQAARALIFWERGEHDRARRAAEQALVAEAVDIGWIPGFPDVGIVPTTDNALSQRVREIAGSASDRDPR